MKTISLGQSTLKASRMAFGCWRIAGSWDPAEVTPESAERGRQAIRVAYEAGYTLYDHADIYCDGVSERLFGETHKTISGMRENVVIATKCGIRKPGEPNADSPYRFDFSGDYIVWSCEQSLKRLAVETIDIFQLHRPDWLMDPEEIAQAFSQLKLSGKVKEFGVSNFRPSQLVALQKACPMPLIVNQIELSLAQLAPFNDGTLDQCLAEKITPLAWSPLAGGMLADGAHRVLDSQQGYRTQPIIDALDAVAKARGVSRMVIAFAWLMKHPSHIVPIVGSTNPARIREAVQADAIDLTRDEWYRLLVAARGERLP
jgi:predicted oxidoreductase